MAPRIQVLYGYTPSGAFRPQSSPPDPAAQFGWRLIGGNNRELARAAQSYLTYAHIGAVVQELRLGLATMDWLVYNDSRTGKWHWHAENAGSEVMTGGRSYERERDCRDCIQHVRLALTDAVITPGVTVLRTNGASTVTRPIVSSSQIPLVAP